MAVPWREVSFRDLRLTVFGRDLSVNNQIQWIYSKMYGPVGLYTGLKII